jgi:hypothetical protein
MSKASLFALAGGVASALLYLLLTTGSPGALVLAYFSQTPLFLVGLGLGFTPAMIACGVALVGLAAATEIATTGLFLALTAAPVVYIVRQSLLSRRAADGSVEWYPPGLLLGGLTVYGLVLLLAVTVWFGGAIEEVSLRYLSRLAQVSGGTLGPQAEALARYVPGAVLVSALLMAVANGALAQGALVRMGHALRPSPAWSAVFVPRWLAPVLAIAVAAALLPDEIGVIGANAAVIAALPFMLVGLAVLHSVSRRWPARGLALGLIYVTTIILGWPAIVVAVLGVVDQWLPLRGPRTA